MKRIVIGACIASVLTLNGCMKTLTLNGNLNNGIMMAIDQKSDLASKCNVTVDVPDTLVVHFTRTDGSAYSTTEKYSHNITTAYESMIKHYVEAKFNNVGEVIDTANLNIKMTDYNVTVRDISAKGAKFSAVMIGVANLRYEYTADIKCNVELIYKGKTTSKSFNVTETSNSETQMRQNTVYGSNGSTASFGTTTSSANPIDAINNCINNSHTTSIVMIDKFVSSIMK